jgi:hypothetical protein
MVNRRRTLITSPLDWFLSANPVPPPTIPVLAERGGTQLKTPRPVLVVDTREQNPFDFSRFEGWLSGVERRALKLGDYSIAGLEDVCVVERKDLSDLVRSFTVERAVFVTRLRQMAKYPHCLLVVTAALSQVKSPYPHSTVNPQITQSLIAMLAGLRVPFICTALRLTKWAKRFLPPTCTRYTFIIGSTRTDSVLL